MKYVTMLSSMQVFRTSRALFNYGHFSAFYTASYNVFVPMFRRLLLSSSSASTKPNSVNPKMEDVPYSETSLQTGYITWCRKSKRPSLFEKEVSIYVSFRILKKRHLYDKLHLQHYLPF
jgi:hypothetical protein